MLYIKGWCGGGVGVGTENSEVAEFYSTNQTIDEYNNGCEDFEDWRHIEVNNNESSIIIRNCDQAFNSFARSYGLTLFCHNFVDNRTNIFAEVACCKYTLYKHLFSQN